MVTDWQDVLVNALIETGVSRIKKIANALGALTAALAGLFPIPGPDADARVSFALLDLADAFDVFDTWALEVATQTVAQLPIPKEWGHRVIRADVAARITLLALANGIYEASQRFDQPAESARTAVLIKRWRYLLEQSFDVATRNWFSALTRALKRFFSLSALKFVSALATLIDLATKLLFSVAGIMVALALLRVLQRDFQRHFLSQKAPRIRVKLADGGSIERRSPGGVEP